MSKEMVIAVAQKDFSVGDIEGNVKKILESMETAAYKMNAQLCVFPELTVCGYLAEDLLWQPDFKDAILQAMKTITQATREYPDLTVVMGFPHYVKDTVFNAMAVLKRGKKVVTYHKQLLPNYGVFDEKRYFTPDSHERAIITVNDMKIGLLICEDIWQAEPIGYLAKRKLDLVVVINASPFSVDKFQQRLHLLSGHAKKHRLPILYVNMEGAQDDIIFDGASFYVDKKGSLAWCADFFYENVYALKMKKEPKKGLSLQEEGFLPAIPTPEALVYQALILSVKDYVEKNNIPGVVLGLSGGIDSALTLAIAVDALGADRVLAVSLPSQYTSEMSITDAKQQADTLGVDFKIINIEPLYDQFLLSLEPMFARLPQDVTEENLQSRCRGVLLMALANKKKWILLNTSNKSELAMGYGTLYGDMAGAYMVLKDVLKTWVYRLAHYRNILNPVIPVRVIERAPSAELAPNQLDQDTLPPYDVLDAIIERYVEKQESIDDIVKAGFDPETVLNVVKRIDANEYKRRQGAPGAKVSNRAFSRERRIPITSGWKW